MRVGLHIGNFRWPGGSATLGAQMAEIARTADAVGLDSLWVMDHLFQLGAEYGTVHGAVDEPMLEGYSTIAYLAGITRRINLGVLVASAFYRSPGLLVKMASTIDVLSGGRTYLGLGAGWYEREARGLGIPVPTPQERYERLEETLRIAHQMWAGDVRPFVGKHYTLTEPLNIPQPLRRPHPPIVIGGEGERKTLRLVAQYADACNFVIGSPSTLEEFGELRARSHDRKEWYAGQRAFTERKLHVLAQHCEAVGRPYEAIEKTIVTYVKLAPHAMEAAEVIELCHALALQGFQHVILNMPNVDEITPLEVLGRDILPTVKTFALEAGQV